MDLSSQLSCSEISSLQLIMLTRLRSNSHALDNLGHFTMRTLMQTVTRNLLSFATGLVALSLLLVAVPQAQAQSVDVSLDDVGAQPGDTVNVAVDVSNLENAADVTSYEFDMDFDSSVMSYVGFKTDGTLSDDAGFTVDDNPSVPRIGAFGSTPINDVADEGTLIYLTFAIDAEGTTTVDLTNFAFNDGSPSASPSTPSFVVQSADIVVSVGDTGFAVAGDTVTVPINTTDVTGGGVTSFEFDMSYNGSVVSPIDVSVDGTIADGYNADANKLSGQTTYRVGAFGSDTLSGSGTLINVRFEVTNSGTSSLEFLNFTYNDGTPAAVTNDGEIDASAVLLGDITANGSVSAFDANRTLLASLGISPPRPLSERDSVAADVTKNGEISSGDASAILQFVVGKIDSFSEVQGSSSKTLATRNAKITWGQSQSTQSGSILPIEIQGDASSVYALQITVKGDVQSIKTDAIRTQLPESWMFVQRAQEDSGTLKMAMAGPESLGQNGQVIGLPVNGSSGSFTASGQLGEGMTMALGSATVTEAPSSFELIGNYPNPVQTQTSIAFSLPENADVSVEVFDMLGRRVATVAEQSMQAGQNRTVNLNASDLSSGVYIYRVSASSGESSEWKESGRMVIAK